MIFNTNKTEIYTKKEIRESINIFDIIEARKNHKRPLGYASIEYEKTEGNNIYYKITDVHYFNTLEIGIRNQNGKSNTNTYRITKDQTLVFDPFSSHLKKPFSCEKGYIYVLNYYYYKHNELKRYQHYYNLGEGYKGEL